MNGLGLSAAQVEARKSRVQAGDAARLMAGEWRQVYREKKGLAQEEDLSGVLAVLMGSYSEPFNLAYCQQVTGRPIVYYSASPLMQRIWLGLTEKSELVARELQVSAEYPFMACNLDGMSTTPQGHPCVIDAKHLGRLGEQEMLRYTPAGVHQATVMGVDWWALSCLIGNSKHEVVYQQVDPLYQARLVAAEREFWEGHVVPGIEPEDRTDPLPPPKPQPKRREILLDRMPEGERPNWAGQWLQMAAIFSRTKAPADLHAITRRDMAALVPEDVGLVQFGLVKQKRDGRGVQISLEKLSDDDGS